MKNMEKLKYPNNKMSNFDIYTRRNDNCIGILLKLRHVDIRKTETKIL